MKAINLTGVPAGAEIRGALYDDPSHEYDLGDVLEIALTSERTIDVGRDRDAPGGPFRIVVYREYFGDRIVDFRLSNVHDVAREVERLALEYSQQVVATSGSPAILSLIVPSTLEGFRVDKEGTQRFKSLFVLKCAMSPLRPLCPLYAPSIPASVTSVSRTTTDRRLFERARCLNPASVTLVWDKYRSRSDESPLKVSIPASVIFVLCKSR
jgi:hypothetical protein